MTYPYSRSTYSDIAGGNTSVHSLIGDEQFLHAIVEFERALATAAHECGYLNDEESAAALAALDAYELDISSTSSSYASSAANAAALSSSLR